MMTNQTNDSPKQNDTADQSPPADKPVAIVGIGASAGGLQAFETFFEHMPADSGLAFVLVPHLDPDHESRLGNLLQSHTAMDVFQVEDGQRVEPNRVHIIPPNHDMTIMHGVLYLRLRFKPGPGRGI